MKDGRKAEFKIFFEYFLQQYDSTYIILFQLKYILNCALGARNIENIISVLTKTQVLLWEYKYLRSNYNLE